MSDIDEHMLAHVNVEETTETITEIAQGFYRRNRDVILIAGAVFVALWLNKRSLRRELKRLNFSIEVFPYSFDEEDGLG